MLAFVPQQSLFSSFPSACCNKQRVCKCQQVSANLCNHSWPGQAQGEYSAPVGTLHPLTAIPRSVVEIPAAVAWWSSLQWPQQKMQEVTRTSAAEHQPPPHGSPSCSGSRGQQLEPQQLAPLSGNTRGGREARGLWPGDPLPAQCPLGPWGITRRRGRLPGPDAHWALRQGCEAAVPRPSWLRTGQCLACPASTDPASASQA